MFNVLPKQTASMQTRDRVRLDADIYRPDAEGEFPVLLMRQPYGRAIASTVVYAHPTWYAAHGYIVVIQDVRGRGTSEGEFKLFAHEIEDGYDTLDWAAKLPGSTGTVGMYGFSYQGMTQLYAAATLHPALKTLCPAMVGYDLYHDWAYENGAFCLQANLSWAMQLAAETARMKGDREAHRMLCTTAKNLPLCDLVPTRSGMLQALDPASFYMDWLEHSEPDTYWEQLSPKTHLQNVNLPMLHIGGWFDTFLRGTLKLYKAVAQTCDTPQHLLIGPWAHLPWGRRVGVKDFGNQANTPCDRLQLRWFDHFLKGKDTGLLDERPIQLFEMGTNQWRKFDAWPTPPPTAFTLASSGLAALDERDGILQPLSSPVSPPSVDTFVHDPWRPVPALGGHAAIPAGVQERSTLECRTDVVTYTSAPLAQDLHLAGNISLTLFCTADAPSFDLCAVLSDVSPGGTVHNISQGYICIKPAQQTMPLQLPLQSTCVCIKAGSSIRLSLSAACFPAFPVNPGTGQGVGESGLIDQQIITIAVHSGSDRTSALVLPIHQS
jgi:uncharacterized protein